MSFSFPGNVLGVPPDELEKVSNYESLGFSAETATLATWLKVIRQKKKEEEEETKNLPSFAALFK